MDYIIGGEKNKKITVDDFDDNRILKYDDDDYVITGTCDDDDFFININVFENSNNHERVHVKCEDNKFVCELDIIPTSLDYMLVQNIDDFLNNDATPVYPANTKITKMCSLKYIKTIDKIL